MKHLIATVINASELKVDSEVKLTFDFIEVDQTQLDL